MIKALLLPVIYWTLFVCVTLISYAAWASFFLHNCFADLPIPLLLISILYLLFRLIEDRLSKFNRGTVITIILLLAMGVRIGWVACVDNKPVSDFAIYEELTKALLSGDGYTIKGPVGADDIRLYLGGNHTLPYTTAYRAPGTSLWGAFLYSIFGAHLIVFKLANVLLGTGSVLILYLLFQPEPFLARRIALLWAVYPPAVMASNLFCSEVLHCFLLLSLALLLAKKGNLYKFIPAGVLLGCVGLVRSMLLPLTAVVGVTIFMTTGWKKGAKAILVVLAFLLLTLSPWMVRNWFVFHRWIPVSTSQGDFLGRHTTDLVPTFLRDEQWQARQAVWRGMADEVERSSEGYAVALDDWKRMFLGGPSHVKESLWKGIVTIFGDDLDMLFWSTRRSYYSVKNEGPEEALGPQSMTSWLWLTSSFYLFILSWSVAGAIKLVRNAGSQFFSQPFLLLYFLAFFFIHILVVGQTRYHFSIMPFLIAVASYGIPRI